MKIFKDESGNYCGFKWWYKWKIAKWHWIKWLQYEGMPKNIKETTELDNWNRNLLINKRMIKKI